MVNVAEEEPADKATSIVKPKATKRKNVKISPQKSPNRVKREKKSVESSFVESMKVAEKPKGKGKTEEVVNVAARISTRSMDKKKNDGEPEFVAPTRVEAALTTRKTKKSPPKKDLSKETGVTRVTRSRSIKQ